MMRSGFITILAILLFFSQGCGNKNGKNPLDNDGAGDHVPAGSLLSAEKYTTLTNAEDLYARLAAKKDKSAAREALVDSLGSWSGVSDVRLWEDGSTVSMKFSDGICCFVETGDSDSFSGSPAAFAPNEMGLQTPSFIPDFSSLAKTAGSVAIPDSTTVLFMVLATNVKGTSDHVTEARKIFLDAGWDPQKVVIKRPTSTTDYAALNPNTLLTEIQHYGIIFLYAHGKYGRPVLTILPQHFIQYCFATDYPNYDEKKLLDWNLLGKVIIGKDYVYIRQDLLAELMTTFPKSVVVMTTCWGYYTRESFLNRGASAVFSWDHVVMSEDAFPSVTRIARRMSSDSPAPSDMDLFNDPLLVKSSSNDMSETAELHLDHLFDNVYFPAWADLSLNTDDLKFPVSGVRVAASSGYAPERKVLFDGSGKGEVPGLAPGENSFTIEALDIAGEPGLTLTTKRTLHAGKNEVSVDLNVQIAQGAVLKYTYEDHYGGYGPYTTDFIRYFKWNRNPNGNKYSVVFHYHYVDREDFVSGPMTVYERDVVDMNKLGETALSRDQIVQIYGKDIIGIGENEVVMISYGSHYGSHKGEDTISDWLKEVEPREQESIARQWYEVYYF
jgi:hypothetical protein